MDEPCRWLPLSQEMLHEGRIKQCPFGCPAMARFKEPVNSYVDFLRVRAAARSQAAA